MKIFFKKVGLIFFRLVFITILAEFFTGNVEYFRAANAGFLGSVLGVLFIIFGIQMIFLGADSYEEHGSKSVTIFFIIVGLVLLASADSLAEQAWFQMITSYVTVIYCSILVFANISRYFSTASWHLKQATSTILKIGKFVFPVGVISRILYFLIKFICIDFLQNMTLPLEGRLNTFTIVLMYAGFMFWFFEAIVDLRHRAWGGKSKSSSSSKSSSNYKTGSLSAVRSAMQSLATYYNGGFSDAEGCRIRYSVSVSVTSSGDSSADIEFLIGFSVEAPSVTSFVSPDTAVQKRKQLILDAASKRIPEIDQTRSYSITVKVKK